MDCTFELLKDRIYCKNDSFSVGKRFSILMQSENSVLILRILPYNVKDMAISISQNLLEENATISI